MKIQKLQMTVHVPRIILAHSFNRIVLPLWEPKTGLKQTLNNEKPCLGFRNYLFGSMFSLLS